MRNIFKIAAGILCAGVLLGGIGTGIAVAEYTSLEYTGEHVLGEETVKTEEFDVKVERKEDKKLLIQERYSYKYRTKNIQYSESVPENTIRYIVKYYPELTTIRLRYEAYEPLTKEEIEDGQEGDTRYQGHVYLGYYYSGNEFDLFMRNKDKILAELKQGKIGSYQTRSIEWVEIWMNPQMEGFAEFDF